MSAAAASSSSSAPVNGAVGASSSKESGISSTDVGWQFVPQYYNFVNKHPQRLHCFYTKHSTFVHGTEGEEVTPSSGQQDIHQKILSIGFKDCKVFIHSVDSQPSANGGIIIQVIGEMFNDEGPWRKFVQTFFLAEQPNGYFVLNDIFRFLKEDTIADDDETAPSETEAAAPQVEAPKETAPEASKPAEVATPAPAAPAAAAERKKEVAAPVPEPAPAAASPVEEKKEVVPEAKKEPTAPVPETKIEEKTNEPQAEIESNDPVVDTTPAPTPIAEKPSAPAAPAASSPAPTAPKAAATPAPAAPTGPPVPKTWASLAKAGTGAWGHLASASQGVSSAAKEAVAAVVPTAVKDAVPAIVGGAAPAANGRPTGGSRHPAAEAAMSVTTAQCFVKLANWAADRDAPVDTDLLKSVLESRFGRVKELEIVKQKACAFLEFHTVEAARKAILASLPVQQGGEGGVKVEDGRVMVEVRKEKSERGNLGGQGGQGPRPPRPNQGERTESGSGMTRGGGGGRGRGGGEGRGGAGRGGPRGGRGGAGGAPAPK